MAKFNLVDEVDVLEFDFRTPSNPDGPFGVIPEPSADQLSVFRTRLSDLIPTVTDNAGNTKIDVKALSARVSNEAEGSALEGALYQSVADLCSGSPSVEQVRSLPFRGQRAFVGWIMGTFVSDPQSAPATNG